MTDTEKPTVDKLRFWLLIITFIAGLVWLYFVYVFRIHVLLFGSCLSLWNLLYIGLCLGRKICIYSPPILLFFSWRFWSRGKRNLSKIYSYIVVIILLAQLGYLYYQLVLMPALFGY